MSPYVGCGMRVCVCALLCLLGFASSLVAA